MCKLPIIILLLLSTFVRAQEGYKQKQFDKMLDGLLSHSVPEIEAKLATYDSSMLYLDARELTEYKVSKIKGAQWVGYNDFNLTRVENIDKNQPIIVYCSIGYRSEKVTEKLQKEGFTNVTNMLGGLFEWINYNKVIIDSTNNTTHKVHGFDKTWGKWLDGNLIEKVY
ncbi:MAG: rhodanese-like domain-containing protein [Cyclobacteriaceae bacterium]|nr:rhodanese-like domain-containing protein [Cyclobacteriaceae bacterium]